MPTSNALADLAAATETVAAPASGGQTVASIAFLKRNPALTPEQFYHHWEHVHGELVKPWAKKHGFISYRQMHATQALNADAAPIGPEVDKAALPVNLADEYDGCAVMEVPSFEAFAAAFKDPYYVEKIEPDERKFIDKKVGVMRVRAEVKRIV